MTRKERIKDAAKHEDSDGYFGFISGAEWADLNPLPCVECSKVQKTFKELAKELLLKIREGW